MKNYGLAEGHISAILEYTIKKTKKNALTGQNFQGKLNKIDL